MSATKESIAAALTGYPYPFSVPKPIAAQAAAAGLLIIYGASDDLMEFDGAFRDEIDAYEGTTAHLDRAGLVDLEDGAEADEVADYSIRLRRSRSVSAIWCRDGYSWLYETEIPHATFEIVEDGDNYCRGIVIDLADLPEPAQL